MRLAAPSSSRPPWLPSFGTTFRALRLPAYRLFWAGQLTSQTGTWMQSIAQAWLVLRLTDSPLALGSVATVQFTPILLFSLIGGVLADRLPKRRLLLITQSVMMAQASILALLTWSGQVRLWQVYVLAAVLGTANALDNPARQAFFRELVNSEDLPNAIALNSMQFNLSRILGPALAGILITLVGVAGCFALNAASSLAVVTALRLIPLSAQAAAPTPRRGNMLTQIGEGFRYAVTTPDVALAMLLMAVLGTFGYNFNTVLPLIARYVLNANPLQFGLLTTAMGLGSLLAAVGLAASGRATRRTLLLGATGFGLLLAAVALSRWWLLTIPLLMALGVFSITFTTTANTRLQLVTPPHLRGRVMSIYMLLFGGTTPIGSLAIGTAAQHAGVPAAIVGAASLCLLGVLGGLVYLRRHRDRLVGDLVGAAPTSARGVATAPSGATAVHDRPATDASLHHQRQEHGMSTSTPAPSRVSPGASGPNGQTEAAGDGPTLDAPRGAGRARLVLTLGALALVVLIGGGLLGYRWWYDETYFVRTDNAQISGFLVAAGALSPGRVALVRVDIGDAVRRDEVVAALHVPVSVTTSTGVTRQEYRETTDTLVEARAPINGVVVTRHANPGDTVPAGQPLVTLVDPDQLWVTANIDETQIRRVRPGQAVTVHIDALDADVEGRVVAIRPASVPASAPAGNGGASGQPAGTRATQLVPVKIALLTPNHRLIVGTSASVQIRVAD